MKIRSVRNIRLNLNRTEKIKKMEKIPKNIKNQKNGKNSKKYQKSKKSYYWQKRVHDGMITIVGAGKVGTSIAVELLKRDLDDINLVDIDAKRAKGESIDLSQMACQYGIDSTIKGSGDFNSLKNSEVVIVPAGFGRKPGMTRMDLLNQNMKIITDVAKKIKKNAPKSKVIMITNPVDIMTYVALKTTGFKREQLFAMSGALDNLRMKNVVCNKLKVSRKQVQTLVIGEHGENMLPLVRYCSVGGIPLNKLINKTELSEIKKQTVSAAAEIIKLKGATFYAPASSTTNIVESIYLDKKSIIPCSTYLKGEYGVKDVCIGVPVKIGKEGIEDIIELELNKTERNQFMKGVNYLKTVIKSINN